MEKYSNLKIKGRTRQTSASSRYKNKITISNKSRGLYTKFLIRLKEADENIPRLSKKDYTPYPKIFEKVCRGFSITKDEAVEILFLLREFGFIDIVKFRGIKLNYNLEYEK